MDTAEEKVPEKEIEHKQSVTIVSTDKPKKEKKNRKKKEGEYEFSEIEMTVMDKKNLAVAGHLNTVTDRLEHYCLQQAREMVHLL